jgi:ABC-type polysaccharide/polyol phosphate export permease
MRNLIFYLKNTLFGFSEEWLSFSNALAQCLLYPFFVWMFSNLWNGVSGEHSTFKLNELLIYVGLTFIIFLTSFRGPLIETTVGNFAVSLTKPRIWLMYMGSMIYGRQLGRRLMLLCVFVMIIPVITAEYYASYKATLRFLMFLPILGIIETFYSLLLSSIQICFSEIKYFRSAIAKLLMIFGGVFTPLSDLSYSWKPLLLDIPFADVIFQPCYYCLKGEFYQLTDMQWLQRIGLQILFCFIVTQLTFVFAKRHYQRCGV